MNLLPPDEPRVIIQTGDGAYLVFSCMEEPYPLVDNLEMEPIKLEDDNELRKKYEHALVSMEADCLQRTADAAFSFVFALNAIMADDNARKRFSVLGPDSEEDSSEFPVFPVETRYAVSYDDVIFLKDVNNRLNCVGPGIVSCGRILSTDHGSHLLVDNELLRVLEPMGGLKRLCGGQWNQRLHTAVLAERKVKTGQFRFADVFGFHGNAPLMQALNQINQKPLTYHIGSHDLKSVSD